MKLEKFTLESFIQNPVGVKGFDIASKAILVAPLMAYVGEIRQDIKYETFELDGVYYVWFKLPSDYYISDGTKMTYDVVFELTKPSNLSIMLRTNLKKYNIRFFSNMPSFGFKYVYTLNKNELLIPSLLDRYEEIMLNSEPQKMNQRGTFGYEKSTFGSAIYMSDEGIHNVKKMTNLKVLKEPEELKDALSKVKDFNVVMSILNNPRNVKVKRERNSDKMDINKSSKRENIVKSTMTKFKNMAKLNTSNLGNTIQSTPKVDGKANRVSTVNSKTRKIGKIKKK